MAGQLLHDLVKVLARCGGVVGRRIADGGWGTYGIKDGVDVNLGLRWWETILFDLAVVSYTHEIVSFTIVRHSIIACVEQLVGDYLVSLAVDTLKHLSDLVNCPPAVLGLSAGQALDVI